MQTLLWPLDGMGIILLLAILLHVVDNIRDRHVWLDTT